jgi:hypothetical protein
MISVALRRRSGTFPLSRLGPVAETTVLTGAGIFSTLLVEVTDDEWQLIKRAIGIDRGWDVAYRLVSTLDLPGPPADIHPDGP